ncbi:forkhead box protein N3-like [Agrilus planipennis]|uniref:Forkhead box protein N3-like n=1 Tax=Agrilus planipennis TaxID=224129 RepID=A0A1W4XLU0_AGRPL|nr:forkhead box protein N3-like [Agrilus planipennis]XP_018333743.1 forkhead box protein N3-like [Agrilus planipennis]
MKMSPEKSGISFHHQQATTPKMSTPYDSSASIKEAESPIALLLAVAQSQNRSSDDDLTSLSWLHEQDLLKGMNIVNPSPSTSVNSTPVKYSESNSSSNQETPTSDYIEESSISASESSSSSFNSPISNHSQTRSKHPVNAPYDPMIHVNSKPPYSFSSLIFMAIEDSHQKALPVKEIYAWILDHFPYFRNAPTGWKNSVRHNLSLNKCFQKVEKAPNLGKGSLWTVDSQYRPNLLQALTRSPFHPCSTLDPTVYFNNNNNSSNNNNHYRATNERNDQKQLQTLFPYLSKTIGFSSENNVAVKKELSEEPLDAVDAAAVMLSLKNGLRHPIKTENQVITTSPSQDHTYSVMEDLTILKDEAFESDDERYYTTRSCRKIDFEDEEERRIKEGAETLLDLAGVNFGKRCANQNDDSDYPIKKRRLSNFESEKNYEKPAQFRPRLLRTKKKDKKNVNNNNINSNNNNFSHTDDDWAKYRRELEVGQRR